MAGADVREIEALRDWIASVASYREAAARSVTGTDQEIRRGFDWIEDQMKLWQRSLKDDDEAVHQAKMELSGRQIPNQDGKFPDTTLQERNLRRALARRQESEEKIETCRRWLGRLPKAIDETYTGPSRRLQSLLDADVPAAMADLDRRVAALEAYAGLSRDLATSPATSSTESPS